MTLDLIDVRTGPSTSLVLDTNVLLLHIIGTIDPDGIERWKRTASWFTRDDWPKLAEFVSKYGSLRTTPNILTEASNLLGQQPRELAVQARALLASHIQVWEELYVPSRRATADLYAFVRLGLTDMSIVEIARPEAVVLTVDLDLVIAIEQAGGEVLNFNRLRTF